MSNDVRTMTDEEFWEQCFWTIESTEPRPSGWWHSLLRLLTIED